MIDQMDVPNQKAMDVQLITEIKDHCHQLISNSRCRELPFHNWDHTLDVVANAKAIAQGEHIDETHLELLIIAAYFHDIGHIESGEEHERTSCKYAAEYLNKHNYLPENIDKIKTLILTTAMPQTPHTQLQGIICDADLAHLGKTSFRLKNDRLRKEWHLYCGQKFTDKEWISMNIKFLKCHSFHTASAKAHYGKQKKENRKMLKDQLDRLQN